MKNSLQRVQFACVILVVCLGAVQLHGQAGLRESLDKMDRNQNGYLDPDEITPLSRPFLERILSRGDGRRNNYLGNDPIRISRIQQSARYYFAIKNGVRGSDVRPESTNALRDFSLDRDDRIVPDFGIAEVRFPYIRADLDEADNTMRRCDRNRDGLIDREEAARNKWTHRNPFDDDLNKDGKLSRLELAQRYARRRLVSEDAGELWQKQLRTGGEVRRSGNQSNRYDRGRISGVAARLSYDMLRRFDSNRDQKLDADEVKSLGIPQAKLDGNQDSFVDLKEIQAYMSLMQESNTESVEGLPDWFLERDENKNKQIEMVEFAEEWSDAKLREFSELDLNSDGVLTTSEVIEATGASGAQYVSKEADILAPKKTMVSEIEIEESVKIAELKVTLSITHSFASHLDAYLLGPEGQRVELFTAVGGSDDHFVNTIFDDAATTPITKARPPFSGSFRPEAIDKKQPGLGQFKGKSAKGVWQLMIRNSRSDRFGMLHQWGLKITPELD